MRSVLRKVERLVWERMAREIPLVLVVYDGQAWRPPEEEVRQAVEEARRLGSEWRSFTPPSPGRLLTKVKSIALESDECSSEEPADIVSAGSSSPDSTLMREPTVAAPRSWPG